MVINFLGDSITAGAFATCPENTFVYKVGVLLNCKVNNYGIGGTRFARQKKPSPIPSHDWDFCSRVDGMEKGADFVFVFGGTNDYGHGDADIGNIEDQTPDTFCGAVNYVISRLLKDYKKEQIVFIMPIYRINEDNPFGENSEKEKESLPLQGYRELLKTIVLKHDIALLDFKEEIGKAENNNLFEDGLHPNNAGHDKIARIIVQYIQKINRA